MPRTKKPARPALGVRFDREGRIVITDPVLRDRIEKRLKAQGFVELYTPGGINELCPSGTSGPKVNPINAMCACGFELKDRTVLRTIERARRTK